MPLTLSPDERKDILSALMGDPTTKLGDFILRIKKETDRAASAPILSILKLRLDGTAVPPVDLQNAIASLFDQAVDPGLPELDGLTANQLRKLIENQKVDLFAGLREDRSFGELLGGVVEKTYENAFKKALRDGAELAIREAALDLLRKCYVSIAAGSKLSDLVEAIQHPGAWQNVGTKPGGGQGDGPTDRAGMP